MAQPASIINQFRTVATEASAVFYDMQKVLNQYQLYTGADADFFTAYLADAEGNPTTDLTAAQFGALIAAMQTVMGSIGTEEATAFALAVR